MSPVAWLNLSVIVASVATMFVPWPTRKLIWATVRIAICIAVSWVALIAINVPRIDREQAAIERRVAANDPTLTQEESMDDGVGDRVALIFCGWLPATIVGCLLLSGAYVRRRLSTVAR